MVWHGTKNRGNDQMYFIGIDIGGTKIAICIGEENGNIVAFYRIQTQPLGGGSQGSQSN